MRVCLCNDLGVRIPAPVLGSHLTHFVRVAQTIDIRGKLGKFIDNNGTWHAWPLHRQPGEDLALGKNRSVFLLAPGGRWVFGDSLFRVELVFLARCLKFVRSGIGETQALLARTPEEVGR